MLPRWHMHRYGTRQIRVRRSPHKDLTLSNPLSSFPFPLTDVIALWVTLDCDVSLTSMSARVTLAIMMPNASIRSGVSLAIAKRVSPETFATKKSTPVRTPTKSASMREHVCRAKTRSLVLADPGSVDLIAPFLWTIVEATCVK